MTKSWKFVGTGVILAVAFSIMGTMPVEGGRIYCGPFTDGGVVCGFFCEKPGNYWQCSKPDVPRSCCWAEPGACGFSESCDSCRCVREF